MIGPDVTGSGARYALSIAKETYCNMKRKTVVVFRAASNDVALRGGGGSWGDRRRPHRAGALPRTKSLKLSRPCALVRPIKSNRMGGKTGASWQPPAHATCTELQLALFWRERKGGKLNEKKISM